MRPRIFLKTLGLLLPSRSSRGASRCTGLHRLTSTLSSAPAFATHSGMKSACQNMEGPVSDSSASILGPSPRGGKVVTTLDPSRLDSSCFMDISNTLSPCIHQGPHHKGPLLLTMPYVALKNGALIRFPAGTHGFLYFYADPSDPLESQLRFRVTESDNPESFAQGADLMYGPGLPFHVHLPRIARSRPLERLRQFLVQDGLVDEAHLAELKHTPATRRKKRLKRPITRLDQPFVYDLTCKSYSIKVCAPRSPRLTYDMHSPLRFHTRGTAAKLFEKGALECRFERSTLPEHAGRRVMLMRLLKILEQPEPVFDPPPGADMTMPAEGELFMCRGRVWQRDLDRPSGCNVGLRVLFDIDAEEKASR